MASGQSLTAIVPCNDLDASEAFYGRLGFHRTGADAAYRMLSDNRGADVHLTKAVEGWLVPGRNPFGLYLYAEDVDRLAAAFSLKAEDKPWGMYEFAVSDPDETLVRIGRRSTSKV
jgi:hypothetical protein